MRFAITFILIVLMVTFGCSKPTKSDNNEPPSQGDYIPVLEADTSQVDGSGVLTLSDGTNLTVYGISATVVLNRRDIIINDPVTNKFGYSISGAGGADSIVISGIIPSEATPESLRVVWVTPDSIATYKVPTITDNTYSTSLDGNTIDIYVVWDWETSGLMKSMDRTLEIPFYSQYGTDYCWATGAAMMFHYYGDIPEFAHKPWEVAGALLVSGGGIGPFSFYAGSGLRGEVHGETGVNPERSMWTLMSSMKNYIRDQINNHSRPVAIFLTSESHLVLAVGWQGENIILHDPATNMYTTRAWSDLANQAVWSAVYYTMVVPKSTSTSNPTVELGDPSISNGFHLVIDTTGREDIRTLAKIEWDGTVGFKGYRWTGSTGDSSPKISNKHNLYPWLRVFNHNRTSPSDMLVTLLINKPDNTTFGPIQKEITVAQQSYIDVIIDTISLENFADTVGTYSATVILYNRDITQTYDRLRVEFPVDTVVTDTTFSVRVTPTVINAPMGRDVTLSAHINCPPEDYVFWHLYKDEISYDNDIINGYLVGSGDVTITLKGWQLDGDEYCPGTNHMFILKTSTFGREIINNVPYNIDSQLSNGWEISGAEDLDFMFYHLRYGVSLPYYGGIFPANISGNSFSGYYDSLYFNLDSIYTCEPGSYTVSYEEHRAINFSVSGCSISGNSTQTIHKKTVDMRNPMDNEPSSHDGLQWDIKDLYTENTITFNGVVEIDVDSTSDTTYQCSFSLIDSPISINSSSNRRTVLTERRDLFYWYDDEAEVWMSADSSVYDSTLSDFSETEDCTFAIFKIKNITFTQPAKLIPQ